MGLARGIAAAPDAVDRITGEWGALFDSGIVVAAVLAVVLNPVLPGRPGRQRRPVASADTLAQDRPPAL